MQQRPTTWAEMIARIQSDYAKRERAFRTFMQRTTRLAAIADPRTSGNECLCRNWGNDAARRIWSEGWQRWRAYSDACDRRYSANMHLIRNGAV